MARSNDAQAQYAQAIEDARRASYGYLSDEQKAIRDAENAASWEAEARLLDLNQEPKHADLRAIERAFPTRLPLVRARLRVRFSSAAAFLAWLELADENARFQRLLNPRTERLTEPETQPEPQPKAPKNRLELERETEQQTGKTTWRVLVADYDIPKSTLGDLLRKWRDAGAIEEAAPQRMNRAEVATVRALLELERQKRDGEKPSF